MILVSKEISPEITSANDLPDTVHPMGSIIASIFLRVLLNAEILGAWFDSTAL